MAFNNALFAATLRDATETYTLRELEERTNVSAATLSRLLRGTTPDVDNLYALCAWIGVSPGAFAVPPIAEMNIVDQRLRRALRQIADISRSALEES